MPFPTIDTTRFILSRLRTGLSSIQIQGSNNNIIERSPRMLLKQAKSSPLRTTRLTGHYSSPIYRNMRGRYLVGGKTFEITRKKTITVRIRTALYSGMSGSLLFIFCGDWFAYDIQLHLNGCQSQYLMAICTIPENVLSFQV